MSGRISKKKGDSFEQLITFINDKYKNQKVAKIGKNEPTVGIIPGSFEGNRFKGFFKEKGKLDFSGVVANGRAIAFDCKATGRKKFKLQMVKRHQIEKIRLGYELGEVTFILVLNENNNKVYIIFAEQLLEKYDKTPNGSFKWDELTEVYQKHGFFDYIKNIKEHYSDDIEKGEG